MNRERSLKRSKKSSCPWGFLNLHFRSVYGGVDGTFTGLIIALRELSYATTVAAWPLFENFMLAYPIYRHGSEAMKKRHLPPLLSLLHIGALAFTEAGTGSDPVQIKTLRPKRWKGDGF